MAEGGRSQSAAERGWRRLKSPRSHNPFRWHGDGAVVRCALTGEIDAGDRHLNPPRPAALNAAAFRQGLSETDYIVGQNVAIEYRLAEGRLDRLPVLAADLVGRKVDVNTAVGDAAALAAKRATSTIRNMLVELMPKRRLLSERVPQARVIVLLINPNDPNAERLIGDVQEAARVKGMQLQVPRASTESESTALLLPSRNIGRRRTHRQPLRVVHQPARAGRGAGIA